MFQAKTTAAVYALKLLEELDSRGLQSKALRQRSGLSASDLNSPHKRVPMIKYLRLVSHVVHSVPSYDLGLKVGERTNLFDHGLIGYAIYNSTDLRQALNRMIKYLALTGPVLEVELVPEANDLYLVARPSEYLKDLSVLEYFVQEWLGSFACWGDLVGEHRSLFDRVCLGYPMTPRAKTFYETHLDCSVSTDQSITRAHIATSLLGKKIKLADTKTGIKFEQQCDRLMSISSSGEGWATHVKRQLVRTPGKFAGLDDMAQRLGVSNRSLRRYLCNENTTYQETVLQVRIVLAKQYLEETQLPIEDISELVGYANAANFYRMFQKTTGLTPADYRSNPGSGIR